jgi:hypothetical protein
MIKNGFQAAMNKEKIEALKGQLKAVEAAITETEKRLPAHSVKPPVMHDLLALEDERDTILRQLDKLCAETG